MTWERARTPEQKAIRKDEILKAARTLFSELDYEEISLNAIAREAGISKPNVYRYFSTREEIFLVIYAQEQSEFVVALTQRLKKLDPGTAIETLVQIWVATYLEFPVLLNLMPQLAISMERSSSVDQLVAFKHQSFDQLHSLVEVLGAVRPELNATQWVQIIQCSFSMAAGLWPFSNPGDNVLEALQHPDVNQEPWRFEPIITFGLTHLIRGAIAESSPSSSDS